MTKKQTRHFNSRSMLVVRSKLVRKFIECPCVLSFIHRHVTTIVEVVFSSNLNCPLHSLVNSIISWMCLINSLDQYHFIKKENIIICTRRNYIWNVTLREKCWFYWISWWFALCIFLYYVSSQHNFTRSSCNFHCFDVFYFS